MATKYLRSKPSSPVYMTQRKLSWLYWSRPFRIALARILVLISRGSLDWAARIAPEILPK